MTEGSRWKRPSSVPHPSVWRRFQGAKSLSNGVKPKFRVQDFTEDMMDDLLDHMRSNFLADEPLCKSLNLKDDEEGVREISEIWREYTKNRLILVCLLENGDELEEKDLPVFAGCNMTGLMEPDAPHVEVRARTVKEIFAAVHYVESQVDCFKRYGVSEFLYALGLSVDRRWRGHGIGLEILKARFEMGRAVGLKLTVTLFTAIASQKLAERVGFETIYELPYQDYRVDGKVVFENVATKTMKLMAARIV